MNYVFSMPQQPSLKVLGTSSEFPVRRVYCIGRNYAEHALEMGHDPTREDPFFFQKNPSNLDQSGEFPFPDQSADVHYEIELALALGAGGTNIPVSQADACIFGYAVALDMTRRDLQGQMKKMGRPWEVGKAFERSAPIGEIVPQANVGTFDSGSIDLFLNNKKVQTGDLNQMIWKIPEIISYLSDYFELAAGDVILTGTPSGVGPIREGDTLTGIIGALPQLEVSVT